MATRAAIAAAAQDLRDLAAARRRAKRPAPEIGTVLDNAAALDTLVEFPTSGGGRLTWIPRDVDVLAILDRHDLRDLIPEPRKPRGTL
jgi:hypothetical protein